MSILKKSIIILFYMVTYQAFADSQALFEGYLSVSGQHSLFYALYGNPDGIPVVVLHGGPGAGFSESNIKFFDLKKFNIIMFDQRGAMRSQPLGCMNNNTTNLLIGDIELLRKHLNIAQWIVFGSSWGSLLSILYGQSFPDSCLGFILSGIFLGRKKDIRLFGDETELSIEYVKFIQNIPDEERCDLFEATYKRVMDDDPNIHTKISKAWLRYHITRTSNPVPSEEELTMMLEDDRFSLSLSRAVFHYVKNNLFIRENQAIEDMYKIKSIPAFIIHGSMDVNCSSEQAVELHKSWENSKLSILESTAHSFNERMTKALKDSANQFAVKFNKQA